jgi:hypothetical protein
VRADTHRAHRANGNYAIFSRGVCFCNVAGLAACFNARERNRDRSNSNRTNCAVSLNTRDVRALADDGINNPRLTVCADAAKGYGARTSNIARISICMKARNQRGRERINVV